MKRLEVFAWLFIGLVVGGIGLILIGHLGAGVMVLCAAVALGITAYLAQ